MNLESTRLGWWFIAEGAVFIALAIGLTVWDVSTGWATVALINIITFASGVWCLYLGRKNIRNARDHHAYMEASRRRIAELWNRDGAS